MSTGNSQFIGAAGQYFVAYGLSVRGMCASLTIGNTQGVDILVSGDDGLNGLNSLSIQVKTSGSAGPKNRYGDDGYEWDVGASVIGKQSPSFWYAFVDLQKTKGRYPQVFFVPSKWVAEFVKPGWSRHCFFYHVGIPVANGQKPTFRHDGQPCSSTGFYRFFITYLVGEYLQWRCQIPSTVDNKFAAVASRATVPAPTAAIRT